jgi:hypothetical protein
VLALAFVTLPFVVRSVQPVLLTMEPDMEEAARCLGAGPADQLPADRAPTIAPALLAGAALAFARAVGEFGSVVILSGNIPTGPRSPRCTCSPLVENDDVASAAAVSVVLLVTSVLVLAGPQPRPAEEDPPCRLRVEDGSRCGSWPSATWRRSCSCRWGRSSGGPSGTASPRSGRPITTPDALHALLAVAADRGHRRAPQHPVRDRLRGRAGAASGSGAAAAGRGHRPALRHLPGGHRPGPDPGLRPGRLARLLAGRARRPGDLLPAGHGPGHGVRVPAVRGPRGPARAPRGRDRAGGGRLDPGGVPAAGVPPGHPAGDPLGGGLRGSS